MKITTDKETLKILFNEEYSHVVVVKELHGWSVNSGWWCKEDAMDQHRDIKEEGVKVSKVWTRAYAKKEMIEGRLF